MSEKLIEAIAQSARDWAQQSFVDDDCVPGGATARTDSPIEAQLLIATVFVLRMGGDMVHVAKKGARHGEEWYEILDHPYTSLIIPQFAINNHRVDFALFNRAEPSVRIVVECDGHDFHERTKKQAQRDKSRDRFIQSKGFKVLRFTGSEIYQSPLDCAHEVRDALFSAVNDMWMARS